MSSCLQHPVSRHGGPVLPVSPGGGRILQRVEGALRDPRMLSRALASPGLSPRLGQALRVLEDGAYAEAAALSRSLEGMPAGGRAEAARRRRALVEDLRARYPEAEGRAPRPERPGMVTITVEAYTTVYIVAHGPARGLAGWAP